MGHWLQTMKLHEHITVTQNPELVPRGSPLVLRALRLDESMMTCFHTYGTRQGSFTP